MLINDSNSVVLAARVQQLVVMHSKESMCMLNTFVFAPQNTAPATRPYAPNATSPNKVSRAKTPSS